ncbi:hypothetical protein Aduo_015461 [Ancylostoma duodenale]
MAANHLIEYKSYEDIRMKIWRFVDSQEEVKSILEPIFKDYSEAMAKRDFEKIREYYAPDAVLVSKNEKKRTQGREAILEELKKLATLLGKTTTTVSNARYELVGDHIILSADFETDSEKMKKIKGKFTQVWRKTNNNYIISYDEFSTEH